MDFFNVLKVHHTYIISFLIKKSLVFSSCYRCLVFLDVECSSREGTVLHFFVFSHTVYAMLAHNGS